MVGQLTSSLSNLAISDHLKTELLSVTERIQAEVANSKPAPDPHQAYIAAKNRVSNLTRKAENALDQCNRLDEQLQDAILYHINATKELEEAVKNVEHFAQQSRQQLDEATNSEKLLLSRPQTRRTMQLCKPSLSNCINVRRKTMNKQQPMRNLIKMMFGCPLTEPQLTKVVMKVNMFRRLVRVRTEMPWRLRWAHRLQNVAVSIRRCTSPMPVQRRIAQLPSRQRSTKRL